MKTNTTSSQDFRDAFPVFTIGYDKKLKSANLTAMPMLHKWHCKQGQKLPTALLKAYPEIAFSLKDTMPTECKIQFGELNIWFDLVPFPEAGYIGLYGYHVEMAPVTAPQNLRIAA
jgi:hypothetical protein